MERYNVQVFQTIVDVFEKFGAWPRISLKKDRLFIFKFSLAFLLSCFLPACSYYHMIYNLSNGYELTARELVQDIVITLATTIGVIIFLYAVVKRPQVVEIINLLEHYSEFGKPPQADHTSKLLSLFLKLYVGAIYMSLTIYLIENGIRKKQDCIDLRDINKSVNICGLMTNTVLPFNADYFPLKQIVILFQFVSGSVFYTVSGCIFYLMCSVCNMLSVKIDHLAEMVSKCFDAESKEEKHKNVTKCVLYHLHIMEAINKINDCFGTMILITVTAFAVIVSVVGFSLLQYPSLKEAMHLGEASLVVVMVYINGQILLDKSEELNEAIYDTTWYDQEIALQKEILFLLVHSQQLIAINANGFGEISRLSLAAFAQTAYSYLTLLNSTM